MMRWIPMLFFCASTHAQGLFQQFLAVKEVSAAAAFDPTNIAGTTNLSWWVADNIGATGTNLIGAISNWVDAGLSPQSLTNLTVAGTTWPTIVKAGLNGHDYAHFNFAANQYLTSANFTSAQPYTLVFVYRWIVGTNTARYFIDSKAVNGKPFMRVNAGKFEISSPTVVNAGQMRTNQWQILELVCNGTSSAIFTNASGAGSPISGGAVSAGIGPANGLTLASVNTLGSSTGPIDLAEVRGYFGTLGAIDSAGVSSVAANRIAMWQNLTNKYPDVLLP